MRPIISLLANMDGSFLNNMQRVYSTLVGISPNFTTVVQIRYGKSRIYDEYNAELGLCLGWKGRICWREGGRGREGGGERVWRGWREGGEGTWGREGREGGRGGRGREGGRGRGRGMEG